jgi:hypothetical protein
MTATPTLTDLQNFKRDIDDIEEIVASIENTDVQTRLGKVHKSLTGRMEDLQTKLDTKDASASTALSNMQASVANKEATAEADLTTYKGKLARYAAINYTGDFVATTAYEANDVWKNTADGSLWIVPADYTSGATAQADIDGKSVRPHQDRDRIESVDTIADLRLVGNRYAGKKVLVGGATVVGVGGGEYVWKSGNYASKISLDDEVEFVAAGDDDTGATGAWVLTENKMAGVNRISQKDVARSILNSDQTANNFYFDQTTPTVFNVFAGVDSLTDGAGGNNGQGTDSYFNSVSNALISIFGDAGKGWTSFDNRVAAREGMSFYRSNNLSYIKTLPKDEAPAIYSLDFGGLHSDTAAISDTGVTGWNGSVNDRDWDTATVYFLQQPGGASISFYQNGSGSVDNIINTDGALSLQSVEIAKNIALNNEIKFRVTTAGKCTVFGVFWKRNVDSGVMCSRLAFGGYQAAYFAGLDDTFQAQWLSELLPTHYILNSGRNDVGNYTPVEFINNVQTYLANFPSSTKKLVMCPNESSTDETSDIREYRRNLRDFAKSNGHGFIDNAVVLGRYDDAVANGWMLDETHPSATGNGIIALNFLKTSGLNQTAKPEVKKYREDPQYREYIGGAGIDAIAPGVESQILEINAKQKSSPCVFKIMVAVKNTAITSVRLERYTFKAFVNSEKEFVSIGTPVLSVEHDDGDIGDIALNLSVVSGNLIVSVAADVANTSNIVLGMSVEAFAISEITTSGNVFGLV